MLKKGLRNDGGNVVILVSLLLFALMGIMALVIDIGVVYAEKADLSKAIDAAILAGGQELPEDKAEAKMIMEEYLLQNGVSLDQVTITIDADGMGAEIVGSKNVDHYFARVIGLTSAQINESSKITLGTAISSKGGLRPFGVTKFDFEYGDPVVLKEGAGDSYQGNFGAISLGGTGTAVLLENAYYGYDGVIKIGDIVYTEPGNMAGVVSDIAYYVNSIADTFDNFSRGSERVWTIPMFDSLEVGGREAVEVVGFAQFFVDEVYKRQGDAEIHGRFIQYVTNGDIDETVESTGALGMKLID